MIKIFSSLLSLSLVLSLNCFAAWELKSDESSLHFVTTKAVHVAEVHQFKRLSGSIDNSGNAVLDIDLTSVDTSIEIRDQRMQEMLFETNMYPKAILNTKVNTASLKLKSGEQTSINLEGELSIHGLKHKVSNVARVTKLANGNVVAESESPIIINAKDFGLVDGIEKLREVAGLPNISYSVAVNYRLTFSEK